MRVKLADLAAMSEEDRSKTLSELIRLAKLPRKDREKPGLTPKKTA